MTWLKTTRQFLTLLVLVALVLGMTHTCVRIVGQSQSYVRIGHPVLKKINEIVYLNAGDDAFVISKPESATLPKEISSMIFFNFSQPSSLSRLQELRPKSECVFINFTTAEQTQPQLDKVVEALDTKTCVFVNTPHLKIKSYLAFKKPRWFFSLMSVDLEKSRFLASIGLESLAGLKGDFIVIDESKAQFSNRLMDEIKRRDIIVFKLQNFN